MIRFWDFKLSRRPPLLSLVVMLRKSVDVVGAAKHGGAFSVDPVPTAAPLRSRVSLLCTGTLVLLLSFGPWIGTPTELIAGDADHSSVVQVGSKILLVYDMEGVTDVVTPGTVLIDSDGFAAARESLTEDVNAAIRGLLKAGAHEVVLTDGHGSGNPEPDYLTGQLPPGARHEIRDQAYDPYIDVVDSSFSAVVAIGMHAGSGETGFSPHTVLPYARWIANGQALNESMIVAASAGRYNVPLILVTGDNVLGREVQSFSPETSYVTVKTAVSISAAEPRPRLEVTNDISLAAERALRQIDRVRPWTALVNTPLHNEFGYRTEQQTALAAIYPGTRVLNNKAVVLETPTFLDAYLAYRALSSYTFLAHMRWIVETMPEVKGGNDVLSELARLFPPRSQRTFTPTSDTIQLDAFARHGSK